MTEAELDRIAAGIRPSWELDDAPFRPGGLASPELEALLALGASGNGVSHSHTNGASQQIAQQIVGQRVISVHPGKPEPEDMLTRVDPVPPVHVLEEAPIVPVRVEAAAAAPLPVPQFVAEAAPQSARASGNQVPSNRPPAPAIPPPSVRPPPPAVQRTVSAQADPFAAPAAAKKATRAKSTDSADFPAIQKSSNKGLFIALGGGAIAAVVAILVYSSSSSSGTKVTSSPTATQMPGNSGAQIPPPPATDDLPATAKATAAPTQSAAPTATQMAELPANTATATPPPPPATHASHADNNPPPSQHHSSPPAHSNPPASGGGGKGKGGIVRDVPF